MKKKWKIILGSAVAVIILGIITWQSTRPVPADLLEIQPATIAKTFTEEGTVKPGVERPIYPNYGGEITDLPVDEGQTVQKGDLLAVIDSREFKLQLQQLQAQLKSTRGEKDRAFQETGTAGEKQQQLQVENAEQEYQSAKTNLDRIKELYELDAVSKQEYEEAQKMHEIARNNLKQQKLALNMLRDKSSGTRQLYEGRIEALQAQIDLMRYKIDNNTMEAPIDGTIAGVNVKEGERTGPGAPVMKIFKENSYLVEVFVLAEDTSRIKKGMTVELVQEKDNREVKFKGTVEKIAPSAVKKMSALGLEERRVKITARPRLPEDIELRPGYTLDVKFTTAQKEDQFVVPKTALFPYKNGDALWVVRNGKAEIQPVEKGFENDQDVAITKGLKKGDRVVLNPQLEGIEEGKRITGN